MDERRVLDPNEQAHARRMGDTWVVSTGFVSVLCADRDAAWMTALAHNAMRAHVPGVVDRRKS